MPSKQRRDAGIPSPLRRGAGSGGSKRLSVKTPLSKNKKHVTFATKSPIKVQRVPVTQRVRTPTKGGGIKKKNDDQRDRTRKALKRSSSSKIMPSPPKKLKSQNTNTSTVKKTIKVTPKRAVKIIPQKGTKGSLKTVSKTRPKKVVKASPKRNVKASPKKFRKTTKPSPSRAISKVKSKQQGSSPQKAKSKTKTVGTVSTSKVKKQVASKTKKTTSKKVLVKKQTTKSKGKGKASATKAKPRAKKPTKKDKKKGKESGKGGVKTKKEIGAKTSPQKGKKVVKHPNSKLVPNTNITVVTKDPMFEVKNETKIPEVSPYVNCKRVIRAVITKDTPLLKKLITNKDIPSVFTKRSVDVSYNAVDYAVKMENLDAVKLLIPEMKMNRVRKAMPCILMEHQGTGSYNYRSLGHAVRAINMGRGCREGDNAFTKDIAFYNARPDGGAERFVEIAFTEGVSLNTLNELSNCDDSFKMTYLNKIHVAVKAGQHKVAGHFVKQANIRGGFGFNTLHQQALLANKPEELGKFKGVSVMKKSHDNSKITPLHCAAINPNPKILAQLLMLASTPSCTDSQGYELIHYAAACTSSGPLQLLLDRGISADQVVPKKLITPLMIAAMYGRTHNIEVLLKNLKSVSEQEEGPPALCGVNLKDKTGYFAIHYAAEKGHMDAVRSLVKHGASVEAMMSAAHNKLTPLMIAAKMGHFELAKMLIEEMEAIIEKRDKIKRTALMLACMNGHYPIGTLLLRKGADPNTKDSSGNTPIHYAAAYGWWHCLRLLLKAGGDPNILNDWKNPPLGIAYLKGHLGCTDLLLDQPNVNVNFRDDNGSTLLLRTCSHPMTEDTVKQFMYLMQKGADTMAVNLDGDNALHLLVSYTNENQLRSTPEVVKLLMDKGCDPTAENKCGKTPITIALQKGMTELLKLLVSKGDRIPLDVDVSSDNPLHHIACNCRYKDQSSVIQLIADMEEKYGSVPMDTDDDTGSKVVTLEEAAKMKNNYRCTPLLRCIMVNRQDLSNQNVCNTLQALIKLCKSDVNTYETEKDGLTARCYALSVLAQEKPSTALSLILDCNPELDVLDVNGNTPLIHAIQAHQCANAKTLLSKGADPNASKTNALLLAVRQNMPDLIPDLLAKGADVNGSGFDNKQPSIMHYVPAYISNLPAQISTAKKLLEAGASLTSVDDTKRTILHNAVNMAQSNVTTEFLELLLDHDVDVFALDSVGKLPLHYAFYKCSMFGKNGGQFEISSALDPIETVSLLVDAMNGKELNRADAFGRTPLHYAAFRGALNSAMYIDERIEEFDMDDENGHTPLALAVVGSKESMATWLIHKGANINKTITLGVDRSETSPQRQLSSKYWIWKPKDIPEKPSSVIKKPLFQDVVHERWQGAVYVMMNRINKFGISYVDAIEAVLSDQQYQLAYELVRKQRDANKLQSTNNKDQNLFHVLAIHADKGATSETIIRITTSLLDHGVKLFARDYKGCTPLHYAAINLNQDLFCVFQDKVPSDFKQCITCADDQGRVPLISMFWALTFHKNSETIIQTLQKSNANLDVEGRLPDVRVLSQEKRNKAGSMEEWYHDLPVGKTIHATPLIFTIHMNCFEGCKFLLNRGASPNQADKDGVTPLMHAIVQNEIVLVNVLLNHNYDPLTAGKQKISNTEMSSLWIANIWEQIDSKGNTKNYSVSINVDDAYEIDNRQDQEKVPKVQKTSQINLDAVDSMGCTAIHYLMKTCDVGTYENVELLELLARLGARLAKKDTEGKTPLDYAMESRSYKMAKALQKLTKVAPKRQVYPKPLSPVWSDGINFPLPQLNIDDDAEAMIKQLEAERSKTRVVEELKPKVDNKSGMTFGGLVLMDEDQNIPYDVIMTKVEVQYGHYGLNNFYKMQIIHQVAKDVNVLFTRWGRIGDEGQFQKTPFGTKEEAISEFMKIFKAKSGNDWTSVANFQKKPKKYMLVQSDPGRAQRNKAIGEFRFNLDSPVPSELPEGIKNVLLELTKPQTLREAIMETHIDHNVMNFSHLPKDVLLKAKEILNQITEKITNADRDRQTDSSGTYDFQAAMDEVYALSNEYFYLIPQEDFAHDRIEPLTETKALNKHKKNLQNLLELEMTNRILLGATYRKEEINPLDYIYLALDCKLKLMDKEDVETQLILQNIHNTCGSNPPKIEAIFRLSRQGEDERLKSCNLTNHKLLWHGSSTINLLSILKQGLLVSPREVAITGSRFGKGLYTSDTFTKSDAYCRKEYHPSAEKSHFLLLCQVALGEMGPYSYQSMDRNACNSTFAKGRTHTSEKRELLLPSGVSINIGKLVCPNHYYSYNSDYNEYVVKTEEQVCLRYLIQCSSR